MLSSLIAVAVMAQNPPAKEFKMKTYQLVFLMSGDTPNPPAAEAQKRQMEHFAHLQKLARDGKAKLVGPIADADRKFRGIVILDAKDADEAKALMADDPWIKGGQLKADIKPWMGGAEGFTGVVEPATVQEHRLVLLWRPKDAPQVGPEEMKKGQESHMANINRMHGIGKLTIAGPFLDGKELRGLFVLNGKDDADIKAELQKDDLIAQGRLKAQILPLFLSKGSIVPEK